MRPMLRRLSLPLPSRTSPERPGPIKGMVGGGGVVGARRRLRLGVSDGSSAAPGPSCRPCDQGLLRPQPASIIRGISWSSSE